MSDVEYEEGADVAIEPSLLDSLRQKHQRIVESLEGGYFDLPGFDGDLVAKYRVLNVRGDIASISNRVAKQTKKELEQVLFAGLDLLARACEEIFVIKDNKRVPFALALGPEEPPVRYDRRLAELLNLEPADDSSRSVILAIWGQNEPMIMEHVQEVSRWMSDTTKKADETFLSS
jgi:hypothetical protein